MEAQHKMEDGTKRVVNKLVSRRKLKKTYEYEVEWKNSSPDQNTWIPRDKCAPPPWHLSQLLFLEHCLHMPVVAVQCALRGICLLPGQCF